MNPPVIWMVTGLRGVGKTAFCRGIASFARESGWDVSGLISPAKLEAGSKTGILAEDLRTGETRLLASTTSYSADNLVLGDWYFDRQAIAWGNRVLEHSLPSDLLVVDELGPLEFSYQMGWQTAFTALKSEHYRLALVVIRSELEATARNVFDFSDVIEINKIHTVEYWISVYCPKLLEWKWG